MKRNWCNVYNNLNRKQEFNKRMRRRDKMDGRIYKYYYNPFGCGICNNPLR